MHKLPALHTLSIPSDKTSALRFGEGSGAGGENNLAFKCTRKRMVFETLHLDVEGGVGERRTKPAVHLSESGGENPLRLESTEKSPMPAENGSRVDVQLEGVSSDLAGSGSPEKTKKVKKKVVFHSDRPDVYDF
jgi:elongator complex protein 4